MSLWDCQSCGHRFMSDEGDDSRDISPGTPFEALPARWQCPACGAPKSAFQEIQTPSQDTEDLSEDDGIEDDDLDSALKSLLKDEWDNPEFDMDAEELDDEAYDDLDDDALNEEDDEEALGDAFDEVEDDLQEDVLDEEDEESLDEEDEDALNRAFEEEEDDLENEAFDEEDIERADEDDDSQSSHTSHLEQLAAFDLSENLGNDERMKEGLYKQESLDGDDLDVHTADSKEADEMDRDGSGQEGSEGLQTPPSFGLDDEALDEQALDDADLDDVEEYLEGEEDPFLNHKHGANQKGVVLPPSASRFPGKSPKIPRGSRNMVMQPAGAGFTHERELPGSVLELHQLSSDPGLADLLFQPVSVFARPAEDRISTLTLIGARASKPLHLTTPFLIAFGDERPQPKRRDTVLMTARKLGIAISTPPTAGELGPPGAMKLLEMVPGEAFPTQECLETSNAIQLWLGRRWLLSEVDVLNRKPGNRVPLILSADSLREAIVALRQQTPGPIGVRLPAGMLLRDLKAILPAEPDFITLECWGAASGRIPALFRTNALIPAWLAIHQARHFLDQEGFERTSLLIDASLRDPMDFGKLLALGADALILTPNTILATLHSTGHITHQNAIESTGGTELKQQLTDCLHGLTDQLVTICRLLGRADVQELGLEDLMTLSTSLAESLGIKKLA